MPRVCREYYAFCGRSREHGDGLSRVLYILRAEREHGDGLSRVLYILRAVPIFIPPGSAPTSKFMLPCDYELQPT